MNVAAILSAILLGGIAGSFLSTVAIRRHAPVPPGRRSRCDGCGIAVRARDNLPVLGFLLLRGRCRSCGGAIDAAHPAMEIGCPAAGGIALALHPGAWGWALALFGWALALLALIDVREQRLPDAFVLPLGIAGLVLGAIGSPLTFEDHAIGALAGFVALRLVALTYRAVRGRDGLGRGDAKLLGAIGAWAGWPPLPVIVLAAALLGLAWAAFAIVRGKRIAMTDRLPFGTLLAVAAWTTIVAAPAPWP